MNVTCEAPEPTITLTLEMTPAEALILQAVIYHGSDYDPPEEIDAVLDPIYDALSEMVDVGDSKYEPVGERYQSWIATGN